MYSELEQKVHLKFSSFFLWPIWIVLVYFRALSATTNNRGEPILLSEEDIGDDCGEGVEAGVEAEF